MPDGRGDGRTLMKQPHSGHFLVPVPCAGKYPRLGKVIMIEALDDAAIRLFPARFWQGFYPGLMARERRD